MTVSRRFALLCLLGAATVAVAGMIVANVMQQSASRMVLSIPALALVLALVAYPKVLDLLALLAFSAMSIIIFTPDPSDVLAVCLLLGGFLTGRFKFGQFRLPWPVGLSLAVLAVGFTLSALAGSYQHGRVDWTYAGNFVLKLMFLFFVLCYVTSRAQARVLLAGYAISGTLVASLAFLGTLGFVHPTLIELREDTRFAALMNDPNVFGSFLAPMVVWLIDEIANPKLWKRLLVLKVAVLLLVGFASVLAQSRGAWVSLAVGVSVYALAEAWQMRPRSLICVVTVLALSLMVAPLFIDRLGLAGSMLVRSHLTEDDFGRFKVQQSALVLGSDNAFGLGPGESRFVFGMPPHNLFVQVFVENGWISILALLSAVVCVTADLLYCVLKRRESSIGLSYSVMLAAWLGLIVNSMVIDTLYWRVLWLLMGLALICGRSVCSNHPLNSSQGSGRALQRIYRRRQAPRGVAQIASGAVDLPARIGRP